MTPKEKYHQKFLKSEFWLALRQKAIERDGGTCIWCGATERLHVHHKIYRDDWYDTRLEDLETLCNTCHRIEHGLWVHTPLDDIRLKIKSAIGSERRPSLEDWAALKREYGDDYVTQILAELILFYCQSVLRKDREFCFAVRDSILSRCKQFKHLAKDSEWRKRIESMQDNPIAPEGTDL